MKKQLAAHTVLVIALDVGAARTGFCYRICGNTAPIYGVLHTNDSGNFSYREFKEQVVVAAGFQNLLQDIMMLQIEYERKLGIVFALEEPPLCRNFSKRKSKRRRQRENNNRMWPSRYFRRLIHDTATELGVDHHVMNCSPQHWRSTLNIHCQGTVENKVAAWKYVAKTHGIACDHYDASDAICIHDATVRNLTNSEVACLATKVGGP